MTRSIGLALGGARHRLTAVAVVGIVVLVGVGGMTAQPPSSPSSPAWSPPGAAGLQVHPEPGGGQDMARVRSGRDLGAFAAAVHAAQRVPASPLSTGQAWVDRGPGDPGGRVTDLAWDGTTLWVASASGGLWRTDETAAVLIPAWDDALPPAIGAIAVLADGALLAGTGEANAGGGSTTFSGDGIHRSTDQGRTWTPAGLPTSSTIARIIAHPTDPDVAWVAAGGDLYQPDGERGVYRTEDGGRTWIQTLAPATPTTGGADIAIDPSDPDHLLAATWDRLRTPSLRRYGGEGSGLHASTDGGRSWQPVTEGIPGFAADSGRIAVAFSPADPAVVYAVVTKGSGRGDGLYRSEDGGRSFRLVNSSTRYLANQFIFGYWFSKVFPAPDDVDRVLVPGLDLAESTDGGGSIVLDGAVHADQHALIWDPGNPDQAWLATDGGIYRSLDGGQSFTWAAAQQQPFTQVYDAAALPAAPSRLAAGFQDNSCRRDDGQAADGGGWRPVAPCGDGTTITPHPQTDEVIVCGQYARCWRTADQQTVGLAGAPLRRAAWSAPLVRLPGQPERLLIGGDRLARSDDAGDTWRPISPDLSHGESPDVDYSFGTITEILPLDGEGTQILVGTDDGLVQRTDDGGTTWTVLVDGDRWVTGLAAMPDRSALFVATSGFFAGDGTAQVRRSTDGGQTWVDITDGLPDAPANDLLVVDDGAGQVTLVVASDVGVSASADPTATSPVWRRIGDGLPQSPALSVDHVADGSLLTVGTFGRGVWQTVLTSVTRHGGADRYATAAAVTGALGPAPPGGTVVLASGENPADALAAAPLVAAREDWSLLLTARQRLPAATADALQALAPAELVVVGGRAAVADEVARQAAVAAGGAQVRRVAGADRTATAAAIAAEHPGPRTVLLSTARTPFDALAGAPLAAALDGVLLLTPPDALAPAVSQALEELRPDQVIALGGRAAISEQVLTAAGRAAAGEEDGGSAGAATDRIAGTDRVGTAIAIAERLLAVSPEPSSSAAPTAVTDGVWLASATAATDALAAASLGQPLLLTPPDSLPAAVEALLGLLRPADVRLAGGAGAIGDPVLQRLRTGEPLAASVAPADAG